MSKGVRRLNRRRYRESVTALKEIIADRDAPAARRLHAIDTLLGIYDRHDRTEARKESRTQAAEGAQSVPDAPQVPEAQETQPDPLEALLTRIKAEREKGTNVEQ
jgi:hypothetical protein